VKLSAHIIYYRLQQKYPDIKYDFKHNDRDPLNLTSPCFINGSVIKPNRVYIINDLSDLANVQLPSDSLYVNCSCAPSADFIHNVIWFDEPKPLIDVYSDVLEIFELFQQWEETLISLTHNEASIHEFMRVGTKVIGNTLFITDAALRIISTNESSDMEKIQPRRSSSTVQPLRLKENEITSVSCSPKEMQESQEVIYIPYGKIPNAPLLAINLFNANIYYGSITLRNPEHEYTEQDKQLLLYFSKYIRSALMHQFSSIKNKNIFIQKALLNMLKGEHVHYDEFSILIKRSGWKNNDEYKVFVIANENLADPLRQHIIYDIHEKIYGVSAFFFQGYIVALLNVSYNDKKHCNYMDILENILKSTNAVAGVSDSFNDIFYMRSYYREAVASLDLSDVADTDKTNKFIYFSDVKFSYLLKNCYGSLSPEMLFTDGFNQLIEHDASSNISYMETLRVYLEENMNALSTAKRLFITRNTFIKRLERIENILKDDLNDSKVRLHLALCLQLYQSRSKIYKP